MQEEDLPPLPPPRVMKEEVCAEEEDFEGLLDDAAPAPAGARAPRAAPAPTSPTSPTGYSDDAEDFEDDESDDEDEAAIGVGVQVEARFGGEEDWYPGTVKAVNADGTYQIAYDDGDEEDSVAPGRAAGAFVALASKPISISFTTYYSSGWQ